MTTQRELTQGEKAKIDALFTGRMDWAAMAAEKGLDQKALVSSHHLPREIDSFEPVTWEELCVRWDMKVLGSVKAAYFAVQMPPGWHLEAATETALWSYLLDEQGRERATIYYQAHFSNRSATMYLTRRYNLFSHYLDPSDRTVRIISARDQRRIFHEFGRVFPNHPNYFREVERIEELGKLWFDGEFPRWQDPFAYWDEQP